MKYRITKQRVETYMGFQDWYYIEVKKWYGWKKLTTVDREGDIEPKVFLSSEKAMEWFKEKQVSKVIEVVAEF